MAARDFETLVNEFIDQYGIGGGGPLETLAGFTHAVQGQTGDLANAVRWIRKANDAVNNLWINWKFLWFEHSIPDTAPGLATGSQAPSLPAFGVKAWDRAKFVLNRGTESYVPLLWMDYEPFEVRFLRSAPSSGTPRFIAIKPNGALVVELQANANMAFYGAGWRRPIRLAIDPDVPDLPGEYDDIIIHRAGIYYANHLDAPEVLEGAQADYLELLSAMQSSELEGFEFETMSTQDIELSRAVPGQDSLGTTR